MDNRTKDRIVSIFNEMILSPVIYMVETDDIIDLICFCDRNIIISDIYKAEERLRSEIGKSFEIIDIREFETSDRLDVMQSAELIYSEDIFVAGIFERSMHEDFENMMKEREAAQIRYSDNRSPFVQ